MSTMTSVTSKGAILLLGSNVDRGHMIHVISFICFDAKPAIKIWKVAPSRSGSDLRVFAFILLRERTRSQIIGIKKKTTTLLPSAQQTSTIIAFS